MGKRKKNPIIARIEYVSALAAERIFLSAPEKLAYFIAGTIADIFFFLDFKHSRRAVQHIMHTGFAANFADARSLARKNFRHMAAMMVDVVRFKTVLDSREKIVRNIGLSGSREAMDLFMKEGARQAIVVTAHYGNWEVAGIGYCCLSGRNLLTIMRQFDNPLLEKIVVEKRLGHGHSLVSKSGSLKAMLRAVKEGSSLCFIADQHAGRKEGVEIDFFGHPARAHKSPALLHMKTGLPIFVAVCERKGPLEYEIKLKDPIVFEEGRRMEDIVRLYSRHLEELISESPEQWCWSHRRWLDINRRSRGSKA